MQEFYNKIAKYKPLIIIIGSITIMSIALCISSGDFMRNFMGLFFSIFAIFKLFNINGFVKGFKKYDLLAQKYHYYAFSYPFIELGLGYGYLSNIWPLIVNIITFIIMSVSCYSVVKSIKAGLDLKCACLGTMLDVPLSTVSIIETLGMSIMSLLMIIYEIF